MFAGEVSRGVLPKSSSEIFTRFTGENLEL